MSKLKFWNKYQLVQNMFCGKKWHKMNDDYRIPWVWINMCSPWKERKLSFLGLELVNIDSFCANDKLVFWKTRLHGWRFLHNGVLELITTEIQILVVDVNYMQLEREACVIKTMELAMRTLKQIAVFTITAESSRAHWLIFIVNKRTDTWNL